MLFVSAVLFFRFEKEPPKVEISPPIKTMGADSSFHIIVSDSKSGIKKIEVSIVTNQKTISVLSESFPSLTLLQGSNVHLKEIDIPVKPRELGLAEGKVRLKISAWDCALKGYYEGNHTDLEQDMIIDTRPPLITLLKKPSGVTQGGAGLLVYSSSEPIAQSGVQIATAFFPGYPGKFKKELIYMALFAIPYDYEPSENNRITLTAIDDGNNKTNLSVHIHVNRMKKTSDNIVLSDDFLNHKMSEFQLETTAGKSASSLETFLVVNRDIRKQNDAIFREKCSLSKPDPLWEGVFLRLPNSAQKAGFAQARTYYYGNEQIDQQIHMGIDLASTENAPIPAANNGNVIFTDNLGIYGNIAIIDHGLGLFSAYSHMSSFTVKQGDEVKKGDIIGHTGTTGLAGGDHLHFAMLVHGAFVTPIEWWDPMWLKNNIYDPINAFANEEQSNASAQTKDIR
ncbi:MAG: M23 family metallopeptidase [Pseudomonadota bacterium]